jgi:hypothetical protein
MTSYNGFLMTVKDMGQPVIGRNRPAAIDEMTAIKKMTDQSGGKTLEEVRTNGSKRRGGKQSPATRTLEAEDILYMQIYLQNRIIAIVR